MTLLTATETRVDVGTVYTWTPQDEVDLTVSGGATPSDTSDAMDIAGAREIVLTINNGNSTDLDVEVFSSVDETTYDNVAYASETGLGATKQKTISITPGPRYIKVKVTNNDGDNATTVTVNVTAFFLFE